MRRVLVPLDGSESAVSILTDALGLVGSDGTLVLVRVVKHDSVENEQEAIQRSDEYLSEIAKRLRTTGVVVQTETLVGDDVAVTIDDAVMTLHIDIIACATHGRSALDRLIRGSIGWSIVAQSTVPVMIRDCEAPPDWTALRPLQPRILVALDGSERAEAALPLTQDLMREWNAALWLVHVIPSYPVTGFPHTSLAPTAITDHRAHQEADYYLDKIATRLMGAVHTHVLFGPASEHLVAAVRAWDITHVVMTSHGRTGLGDVVFGNTAQDLIEQLHCPIIIIPSHASGLVSEVGVATTSSSNKWRREAIQV
jgi:nucleotide-binding universal stress UspA family protein